MPKTPPQENARARPASNQGFEPDPAQVAAMRSSRPPSRGAVAAYDWLTHHRLHRPKKEAIRELGTERRFSYADLDTRADDVLRSLGHLPPAEAQSPEAARRRVTPGTGLL